MGGRLPIILLAAAVLAVSGCRDEQAALMAPPDPEPAGVAAADVAGVAVADSTTETETCETIEVEVDDDGKTKTVYLCRRESEDAGGSAGADGIAGDGGDGTICWYWVVEYRIAGILVGRTVTFLFCEDDAGGCGGGGGGGGGGGPQADCVAASLTLTCPTAERGSTAVCTATVAEDDDVDASELVFDWSSGFGAAWTDTTGTDESEWSSEWSGEATDETEITVTVTGGGISEMSESVTITVTARTWPSWESVTQSSPKYFDDLDPDIWGAHEVGTDPSLAEQEGDGPWEGTVIVASRPVLRTGLWLHTDFLSDGMSYGNVDKRSERCVQRLGSSANVYEVNDACGTLGVLSSFHDTVLAHERKHETSLNKCLESQTVKDRLRDLEALVGKGDEGSETLQREWDDFYLNVLDDANEGGVSGDQSDSAMWHRVGRGEAGLWDLSVARTAGHGGTDGC